MTRITINDLTSALHSIKVQRVIEKIEFEDHWIEVDSVTKEPIKIGLTDKGIEEIKNLFNFQGEGKKGKITTIYGIPIIKSESTE